MCALRRLVALAVVSGLGGVPSQASPEASCEAPQYQKYAINRTCDNAPFRSYGSSAGSCQDLCDASPRCTFFAASPAGACGLFDQCLGLTHAADSTVFWKVAPKVVVSIGPKLVPGSRRKCVQTPDGAPVRCAPSAASRGNRVNQDQEDADDAFSVAVNGSEVCAERTDGNSTWEMNLEVACCRADMPSPFRLSVDGACPYQHRLNTWWQIAGYTASGAPFYWVEGGAPKFWLYWDPYAGCTGANDTWTILYQQSKEFVPSITQQFNLTSRVQDMLCPNMAHVHPRPSTSLPLGTIHWRMKCQRQRHHLELVWLTIKQLPSCPDSCYSSGWPGACTECAQGGVCRLNGRRNIYCPVEHDCSLCPQQSPTPAAPKTQSEATGGWVTVVLSTTLGVGAIMLAIAIWIACWMRRAMASGSNRTKDGSVAAQSLGARGRLCARACLCGGGAPGEEEVWAGLKAKWGFLERHEHHYTPEQQRALVEYLSDPGKWSISWSGLKMLENEARGFFGEDYPSKSMLDVVQAIVKPMCESTGAPAALAANGWVPSPVDGFVTHCWQEPFEDFMASLTQLYGPRLTKPNLFVCAFTLFQGSPEDISNALGESIEDAPFVRTLRQASHLTVVRNRIVDIYERGWCLVEFIYSKKYGLYPEQVYVTGPNTFQGSALSVMDAKASVKSDKEKILKAILGEGSAEEMDEQIRQIRSHLGC